MFFVMDRISSNIDLHLSLCRPIVYGKGDSVPIDQQSAQVFNIDPDTGRPVCDLTLVMRANNRFERDRILADLPEFKKEYLPDDISDDDAMAFACPRLAQLPSEKLDFQVSLARKRLADASARREAEYQEKVAEHHARLLEEYDTKSE